MKRVLTIGALAAVLVLAFASVAFAAGTVTLSAPAVTSLANGSPASFNATYNVGETTTTVSWKVSVAHSDGTTITASDLAGISGTLGGNALSFDQVKAPPASGTDTFSANAVYALGDVGNTSVYGTNVVLNLPANNSWVVNVSAIRNVNKGMALKSPNALFIMTADITPGAPGSTQPPTNIGANGAAVFSYKDLADNSAKPEGGYAAFDGVGSLYASNGGQGPHGGYTTTSNKCKVCHAVHRAEGAYYLLRADSQDDACDYCHIGGSAHSSKVVYDLNGAGTATTNGHTIGAQTQIPDSSDNQVAQAVQISTTDSNGNPLRATINVRSYDSAKNEMYRLTRHHAQAPVSTGRSGWKKVGPYALRCMNCHQPHNAQAQIWQPPAYDNNLVADGANLTAGYKLLRKYPSGSTVGAANAYGMFDAPQAVKVPESLLTAGTNFSTKRSGEKSYTENGVTAAQPLWVAQGWDLGAGTGPSEDPATVNQYTLSVWCADCHNLNIGGAIEFEGRAIPEELGFKAHTERTHPAPYVGAHSGPGQCYSCHRDDLSVMNSTADPVGYGSGQGKGATMTANGSCTQCHYGTQAYAYDHDEARSIASTTTVRDSDFPHSGKPTDMKLLGSYSITPPAYSASSYTPAFIYSGVSETNLDAVCVRCHPGIGVHN